MAVVPRIMIVEDEIVVAMEIESKLAASGYGVTGIVSDGDDAVSEARRIRPDLVLMDITLSGETDGIEAARVIHEQGIPVVFLTAHSDEATLQRAKLSEPYGYLLKPFSAAELHTTIEVSLHKHTKERKAKEAARCFSTTVSLLGGAVIVTDETGVVSNMNPLAEALTGRKAEQAAGMSIREVCAFKNPTGDMPQNYLEGWLDVPGWVARSSNVLLVDQAGEEIPVELTVASLDDHMNGATVVWGFHETAPPETSDQDWFSQSVNLQIAARLALSEGRRPEAEIFFRRALALAEENLGRSHPKVAPLFEALNELHRTDPQPVESRIMALRNARLSHRPV